MTPFPNVCSPFSVINFKILEFSHGQDGRGPKTTFSFADTTDSSVAVSGDLMEYFGSGIVNKSIRPILSRHFTGLIKLSGIIIMESGSITSFVCIRSILYLCYISRKNYNRCKTRVHYSNMRGTTERLKILVSTIL